MVMLLGVERSVCTGVQHWPPGDREPLGKACSPSGQRRVVSVVGVEGRDGGLCKEVGQGPVSRVQNPIVTAGPWVQILLISPSNSMILGKLCTL